MTTPSELSSPFQVQNNGAAFVQTPTNSEEFSFRTMHEDLLAPPKSISTTPITPTVSASIKEPNEAPVNTPNKNNEPEREISEIKQNPFLEKITPADNRDIFSTPIATPVSAPLLFSAKKMPIEIPTNNIQTDELPATRSLAYQSLIFMVILLVVGIVGLSGYYFWINKSNKQVIAIPIVEETIVPAVVEPIETPAVMTPPVEKYSTEKPNYLILDMATIAASEIQAKISGIAIEIKGGVQPSAYEFSIVDANNKPVTFSAFAAATKLNFSPTLLKAMGDKFSLFIHNDGGEIRMGLSTILSDPAILTVELQKQEKTLPSDISFMFLGSIPNVTTGNFNSGTYDIYKTRYFNLNEQGTLSIDYVVTDKIFALGTSKNTLRAVLNKKTVFNTETIE